MEQKNNYLTQYKGSFYGVLQWDDLDQVWKNLKQSSYQFYIYQIGETPPDEVSEQPEFQVFIDELDQLLRREHEERFCGIVYINDKENPDFIKIYDPSNLGSSCGSSGAPPPLPGWTISVEKPVDLKMAFPLPANRKRWWKKLFR